MEAEEEDDQDMKDNEKKTMMIWMKKEDDYGVEVGKKPTMSWMRRMITGKEDDY